MNKACLFGKVLADQTVRIFIRSTLPWALGITDIVNGPALVLVGMVVLAFSLPLHSQGAWTVLGFICLGMVLVGFGIGLGWPHLLTRILQVAPREDQDAAATSITTVQLFATALGSALAGMLANRWGLEHSWWYRRHIKRRLVVVRRTGRRTDTGFLQHSSCRRCFEESIRHLISRCRLMELLRRLRAACLRHKRCDWGAAASWPCWSPSPVSPLTSMGCQPAACFLPLGCARICFN